MKTAAQKPKDWHRWPLLVEDILFTAGPDRPPIDRALRLWLVAAVVCTAVGAAVAFWWPL